jgi:hypothetical protein
LDYLRHSLSVKAMVLRLAAAGESCGKQKLGDEFNQN